MAKAPKGILGPVTGSIGNLTFYELNGQAVLRRKSTYSSKPTEARLRARSAMRVLMNLFTRIKPFLRVGFINHSRGTKRSYYNAAMSYNLRHGLKLELGGYKINFESLKLSTGNAEAVDRAIVERVAEGLAFNWQMKAGLDWESQNDQVMMMAYFPTENEAIFELHGARRSTRKDVLIIPPSLRSKAMEVYISFVSSDRLRVAESFYLGRLNEPGDIITGT